MGEFRFFPESASSTAAAVDYLYFFQSFVSIVMTLLIFAGVIFFAFKYRRRSNSYVPPLIHGSLLLEIGWSIAPFFIMLVMYFWGAKIFFDNSKAPDNALDIYVVGKQWMWKVQYPGGQHEINELHVPLNRPVKLTLASEDVIHSFFLPAMRVKKDVVPGRYNSMWFTATKAGRYHIFCAEYCGTEHSGMIGTVTVLPEDQYQNWLAGGTATGSMAEQGERLFTQLGCSTCHLSEAQGRCPNLRGIYGTKQILADGQSVLVDDPYLRESILNPNAKIVAGYKPDVMPTFQGQVNEEGLLQLIAYVKSIGPKNAPGAAPAVGAPTPAQQPQKAKSVKAAGSL